MPIGSLTVSRVRRRFVLTSGLLVTLVAGTTVASAVLGYSTTTYRHHGTYTVGSTSSSITPTAAEQRATLRVTTLYRREVVTATERFSAATVALDTGVVSGNYAAARQRELDAQGDLDVFRLDVQSRVLALAPLDTLVANQPSGTAPTGLHAIERDLWSAHPAAARAPAGRLAAQGPAVELALYRTIVTPTDVCQQLEESLGWMVEDVIDSPQEVYSHHDLVDVRAIVASIVAIAGPVESLGRLVAPATTRTVALRVAALRAIVAPLAPSSTDAQITPATWFALAQAADATLAPLGRLSGALYGLGTGRTYA